MHTAHPRSQLFKQTPALLNDIMERLIIHNISDNNLVETLLESAKRLIDELVEWHADGGAVGTHVVVQFGWLLSQSSLRVQRRVTYSEQQEARLRSP